MTPARMASSALVYVMSGSSPGTETGGRRPAKYTEAALRSTLDGYPHCFTWNVVQ